MICLTNGMIMFVQQFTDLDFFNRYKNSQRFIKRDRLNVFKFFMCTIVYCACSEPYHVRVSK